MGSSRHSLQVFTRLYLLYENIPGFWDGRFEIPIEKSPLRFDDQKTVDHDEDHAHHEDGEFAQKTKVGIGNIEPRETLDVTGGIRANTIKVENDDEAEVPFSVKGKMTSDELMVKSKVVFEANGNGPTFESKGGAKMEGQNIAENLEITGTLKVSGD